MVRNAGRVLQGSIITRNVEWGKSFDLDEYVRNPPLIKRLHEDRVTAVESAVELDQSLASVEAELQRLKLENQRLRQILHENIRRSSLSFVLSLMSVVTIGIGVNTVTSDSGNWLGWVLIVIGCTLALAGKPKLQNE